MRSANITSLVEEQVYNCIKKYKLINENDKVLIGVSGGPDSICILHILNKLKLTLKIEIYVAHVNHMIRKEADKETEYVKEFCKNLNVECFIKKIDVVKYAKEHKIGIEEAGRNIRYNFFEEVSKNIMVNKIVTAHNSNDNAETVLLNIIRGSGLSGLKGIEPIRENKYIRPLIQTERIDIEKYCIENKLQPKIDKSNLDNEYTRNKTRNLLIPYIKKEFNSNIINTINRLSEIVSAENEYMEETAIKRFNEICIIENINNNLISENQVVLDLKKFNNLELVIKRRVILYTIKKVIGNTLGIEKVNVDEIVKLCENNIGNKYLRPNKNLKVLVRNKKIYFINLNDLVS